MKALIEQKLTNEMISSGTIENMVSSPNNKEHQEFGHKAFDTAVEFYKKLCLKLYISTNTTFVNLLKQDTLNIFLDIFTLKEMNLINKTIGKFNYFKNIILSSSDPTSHL